MKLTKQECMKEIHNLERYIGREFECSQVMIECENSLDVLEKLINEYFELIKAIEFIFGVKSEDVLKEYEEMG